jgi:hypothetical protein
MKEGIVPVPQYLPCAERDDNVFPVQEVITFGGRRSGGGETPESVQVFLNISIVPGEFPFFEDGFLYAEIGICCFFKYL